MRLFLALLENNVKARYKLKKYLVTEH